MLKTSASRCVHYSHHLWITEARFSSDVKQWEHWSFPSPGSWNLIGLWNNKATLFPLSGISLEVVMWHNSGWCPLWYMCWRLLRSYINCKKETKKGHGLFYFQTFELLPCKSVINRIRMTRKIKGSKQNCLLGLLESSGIKPLHLTSPLGFCYIRHMLPLKVNALVLHFLTLKIF